jgi:hypothetical protein
MSRKNDPGVFLLIAAVVFVIAPTAALANPTGTEREAVSALVLKIQKADYEDDRAGLQHLYGELAPFTESKDFASRVRYWRGFALWRKAINGFNDNVDKKDLEQDLHQAAEEFEKSATADPAFVDAKIALGSCFGLLAYSVNKKDPTEMQALVAKSRQALKDAQTMAPDNPRLLWVLGPIYWNIPAERGGGQAKAMDAYEKGLETLRTHKNVTNDPLEPTWGEPELVVNLAWSNLNRTTPDLNAAEKYAQSALALVPNWHYVREILMQQIRDAKAKQSGTS